MYTRVMLANEDILAEMTTLLYSCIISTAITVLNRCVVACCLQHVR